MVATPAFFWFLFSWYSFFIPLISNFLCLFVLRLSLACIIGFENPVWEFVLNHIHLLQLLIFTRGWSTLLEVLSFLCSTFSFLFFPAYSIDWIYSNWCKTKSLHSFLWLHSIPLYEYAVSYLIHPLWIDSLFQPYSNRIFFFSNNQKLLHTFRASLSCWFTFLGDIGSKNWSTLL